MKYCSHCGAPLSDEASFCTACGQKQSAPTGAQKNAGATGATENAKVLCVLSYIPFLWLIGLLVRPDNENPTVRFHVGQGIILTIATAVISVAISLVSAILGLILGWTWGGLVFRGVVIGLLTTAASVLDIYWMVQGIINACRGQNTELPIIGRYAFYR